jgi:hypothetical protein
MGLGAALGNRTLKTLVTEAQQNQELYNPDRVVQIIAVRARVNLALQRNFDTQP